MRETSNESNEGILNLARQIKRIKEYAKSDELKICESFLQHMVSRIRESICGSRGHQVPTAKEEANNYPPMEIASTYLA